MKYKVVFIGILLILSFMAGYWFRKPKTILISGSKEAVIVTKPGEVRIVTREKEKKVFVPIEGKTEIIKKKDGSIELKLQTRGFCVRPGLGFVFTHPRVYPAIDLKLAYWNRWGLLVGVPVNREEYKRPYVAASFQVRPNTAVFVGSNTRKKLVAGFRLSF